MYDLCIYVGILFDIGIIAKDRLVEVQRSDIVSQYIGGTAKLTKEKIKEAAGGVLFVDEAYTLVSTSEKDFGKESIETMMTYMLPSPHLDPVVFIFAGYRERMDEFLCTNQGLDRRIEQRFHMSDYKSNELAAITCIKLYKKSLEFPVTLKLEDLFDQIPHHVRQKFNASLCEKMIFETLTSQESRLPSTANKKDLVTLTNDDFVQGTNRLVKKLDSYCIQRVDVATQTIESPPPSPSLLD